MRPFILSLLCACALAACNAAGRPDTTDDARAADESLQAKAAPGTYIVAPGDTVTGIGRRIHVSPLTLIELNHLEPPFIIHPGQVLQTVGESLPDTAPVPSVGVTKLSGVGQAPLAPPPSYKQSSRPITPQPVGKATPLASARASTLATQASASGKTTSAIPIAKNPAENPGLSADKVQAASASEAVVQQPSPSSVPTPPVTKVAAATPVSPVLPASSSATFLWPVSGKIIGKFGAAADGLKNDGINIAAPDGAPVKAAADGVVAYAGNELRGFGNLVLIRHANGWITAYAHNDALMVKKGDMVKKGQVIAKVGQTGGVDSPQLHFEVRRGAMAVDPLPHLPPQQG
ncbi:MAG TPA: M23 family metallopeptidase [Dongiaceae bacterium]|jgi:murein DD-endopeptidase MepM/ murein hydrolase activator NlpD|nr:M23 family metallopeptidase [Dongiaceae bacterium]